MIDENFFYYTVAQKKKKKKKTSGQGKGHLKVKSRRKINKENLPVPKRIKYRFNVLIIFNDLKNSKGNQQAIAMEH